MWHPSAYPGPSFSFPQTSPTLLACCPDIPHRSQHSSNRTPPPLSDGLSPQAPQPTQPTSGDNTSLPGTSSPIGDAGAPPLLPGLPAIPRQLLTAIRAGEFVDLGRLLPEALAAASFSTASPSERDPKEKVRAYPIRFPVDWALAFATYSAVIAQATPERAGALMTYMAIILRMARQSGSPMWLTYDREFRHSAALDKSLKWDRRATDIWLAAMAEDHSFPQDQPPTPAIRYPDRFAPYRPIMRSSGSRSSEPCIRWNRGVCVPPCRYTHVCLHCRDPRHAAKDCSRARHPPSRPPPY